MLYYIHTIYSEDLSNTNTPLFVPIFLPVTQHVYRGELQETFKAMKVSRDMRLSWLQRWQSMDTDGSNLLDYAEFVQACGLNDNMWSWRMFNLLDKNFVGKYTFARGRRTKS